MPSSTAETHRDAAVLFAVVVEAGNGPLGVVLVWPTAAAADGWAKATGLGEYRVVPAVFAATGASVPALR